MITAHRIQANIGNIETFGLTCSFLLRTRDSNNTGQAKQKRSQDQDSPADTARRIVRYEDVIDLYYMSSRTLCSCFARSASFSTSNSNRLVMESSDCMITSDKERTASASPDKQHHYNAPQKQRRLLLWARISRRLPFFACPVCGSSQFVLNGVVHEYLSHASVWLSRS